MVDYAVFETRLHELRDEMTSRINAINKDVRHRAAPVEKDFAEQVGCVILLVGPEGGLAPAEVATAQRWGFQSARMGPRVLRTETAALAALAAIQVRWGDF